MKKLKAGVAAAALLLSPFAANAATITVDGAEVDVIGIFDPGNDTTLSAGGSVDGNLNVDADDGSVDLSGVSGSFTFVGPSPSVLNGTVTVNPFFDEDDDLDSFALPDDFDFNDLELFFNVNGGANTEVPLNQAPDAPVATAAFSGVSVDPFDVVNFVFQGSTGDEGNDIDVVVRASVAPGGGPGVIPVPPAILLLASGALGLFVAGRRRPQA